MRWCVVGSCVGLLLLGAAEEGWAQRSLGELRGQVRDASGAALSGARVDAQSAALVAPMTQETSAGGRFRFAALPPGEYEVSVQGTGGASTRYSRILIGPGDVLELDVVLDGRAPTDGAVVPPSSGPALANTVYDQRWVAVAPIRRSSMFDLLNMAPGISAATSTDDSAQAFGSSTNENRYYLDGHDTTSLHTGTSLVRPNPDAIEAVQVLSLGASAEYGAVPGAVFNVITRQGGAAWHGGVNAFGQPPALTGRNTTDEQDGGRAFDRARFLDVTGRLGGALVRERLWVFGAAQMQRDDYTPAALALPPPVESTVSNVLVKATGRFGGGSRYQLQLQDDAFRSPEAEDPLVASSARAERRSHAPAPSGAYWGTLAGLLVEVRGGGVYGRDDNDPEDGSARIAKRFTEFNTGRVTGGVAQWFEGKTSRTNASIRATKPLESFGLGHDLGLGVQFATGGSDYLIGNNDDIGTVNGRPIEGYTQAPHHRGGRARELGLYVDDLWRMGRRVTVTAGLRYDRNTGSFPSFQLLDRAGSAAGTSASVSPVFSWNVVSPRAGVVLNLRESGRTVVRANVGRYYRGIVTSEFDVAAPSIAPRYWFTGSYDRNDNPIGLDLVDSVARLGVNGDLRNPYIDQFGASFEHHLGATRVSASFVAKRGRAHTAWQDVGGTYRTISRDVSGTTYQLSQLFGPASAQRFQLTNPAGMETDYRGVTIALENRTARRMFLRAAVTFSESTGQLASSGARTSPTDPQVSFAPTVDGAAFGQNPNDFVNADGVLAGDRPVVFKAQMSWDGPWGFGVAANAQYQTGRPWGREARVIGLGVGTRLLLAPLSDDQRVEDLSLVDVRLHRPFGVGRARVDLLADVFNVFNDDAGESVIQRQPGRPGFAVPTQFVWPRRVMVGAKLSF